MLAAPFNKDRISPIYKAGAVNLNGRMSANDVKARLDRLDNASDSIYGSRFAAYYDAPSGVHGNSFRTLDVAEFAFMNRDFTHADMQQTGNTPAAFSENVSISVMTTLNLLGDYDDSLDDSEMREAIMLKLVFVGVVVADNRQNNESHVTLMSGGLMTVTFDGTQPGNAGDWLILECPPRSDIANKKGGRQTAEEQDGNRVTLRLGTYDARLHSHTPKYVYAALKQWDASQAEAKRRYLHSYLTMCIALHASICRIVAAGLIALSAANGAGLNMIGGQVGEAVSALCGTTIGGVPVPGNAKAVRSAVRDAVFAAYTRDRALNSNPLGLEAHAMEGIGLYMRSSADHVRIVLERVVCKALTQYAPQIDLDVSFIQPSR